ncbi:ribonuclease HII [Actibacterium sp. 188UL27-1]|uniref:ribonuclease HII n=1 Tax=Actibacterium sp. 188UL27-1 TaxID=2786961 RepID=UPI001957E011|nr:ribonuclease HII [Actibacterium sp. 188UL27-1]MBM7065996.1 ribonuclease HII [Actibacterium sp. 188UL27-1]
MRSVPDFQFETQLLERGLTHIAGVDEVGRGPLAGPVTAAAVILDPNAVPDGLNDSKQLTARRREALAEQLHESAQVSIVHVGVADIEVLNILNAAQKAMALAVAGLARPACHALIDGNRVPGDLVCPATPLVKGDTRSLSISAASIVAKVARDRIMVDLAQQHPGYGWESNMGYPTAVHLKALQDLGITPHHRRSFAPVRNILWQEKSPSY